MYLLIQRLQKKLPTAVQYLPTSFLLFDKRGVRTFPGDRQNSVLLHDTWALSDSNASISSPCPAFLVSGAVVIQATSPHQSRWKTWRKDYKARLFVMDLWSRPEMGALMCVHFGRYEPVSDGTLRTLCNLNVRHGLRLMDKYGPSPRNIIEILQSDADEAPLFTSEPNQESQEALFEDTVSSAAATVARALPANIDAFKALELGKDSSSIFFFVRPRDATRRSAFIFVPTVHLIELLSTAMLSADIAAQQVFFTHMSGNAKTRSAAGWLFENFLHTRFTAERAPAVAVDGENNIVEIETTSHVLPGTQTALKTQGLPFYWRPSAPNFAGIDALLCNHHGVFALQSTISYAHESVEPGLVKAHDLLHPDVRQLDWHIVIVGPQAHTAAKVRDDVRVGARWSQARVLSCEIILREDHADALKKFMVRLDSLHNWLRLIPVL